MKTFEQGFTLLELMVAMAIFAALAVSGWQVFDSVNRARDRAQLHANSLAELQFAYLQLQQDLSQIVPYQIPIEPTADTNQDQLLDPTPFAKLDANSFSFVRFADPDPRFQSSPTLERIDYMFDNERLIRRQYFLTDDKNSAPSLDSVILTQVNEGRWQAFLPKLSATFPSSEPAADNQDSQESPPLLLPKGVQIAFSHNDSPITWQWAIVPDPKYYLQSVKNKAGDDKNNPPPNNNAINGNNLNNDNHPNNTNDNAPPNNELSNLPDGLL